MFHFYLITLLASFKAHLRITKYIFGELVSFTVSPSLDYKLCEGGDHLYLVLHSIFIIQHLVWNNVCLLHE